MTTHLTADDFNRLFRYFERTAFRLEVQPVYLVDYEQPSVAAYLSGKPEPVTAIPQYQEWLDRIRDTTDQGRRVERVRVTEEPPTGYQRWEAWAGQWNTAAGEIIRYMPRSRAEAIGLPLDADWWLFDSQRLALMRFAADGTPLGGEIISDPEIVALHLAWQDTAIRHSDPSPDRHELSGIHQPSSLSIVATVRSVIMKGLAKYWGYAALAVLLSAWWLSEVGPAVLIALSVAVTLYFLLQAPVWCGAENRDGTLCRRNASGLLLGCSFRQHKWQKLKLVIVPVGWRRLNAGLWTSPATCLATVATALGIISTSAALVRSLVE